MPDPHFQAINAQPLGISALRLDEMAKSFHRNLLVEARACLASQQPEMTVVLAQASAELCTEWAITALFSLRQDHDLAEPILDLFQVKDICNERVRAVYTALSKDHPQKATFWAEIQSHRTRRHSIVHRGAKCTPSDAESSVKAVALYVGHVEGVVTQAQAK